MFWIDPGGQKHVHRKFPELRDAIDYAKALKSKGNKTHVVCMNKAWPPTKEQQLLRKPEQMWCPYCIKWRKFRLFRIKTQYYTTEAKMRCPICTISTDDYWVKKNNGFIEHITEAELVRMLNK